MDATALRAHARQLRDRQWHFMARIAAAGTLWYCNWNKRNLPEAVDELRDSLLASVTIADWVERHPNWFVEGPWDDERYAFSFQLTDAGREALAHQDVYDLEPVSGGLVAPGWTAIPLPRENP